jgi:hypothetical protein
VREEQGKPLVLEFKTWLEQQLTRVSAKSPIAEAIRYGFIEQHGRMLMFYLISKVTNNVPPIPKISPIRNAQSKLRACSRCRSRPSARSIAGPGLSDQVVVITEPQTAAR